LILLCINSVLNVYITGLSVYLRAHKEEPFLLLSIIIGLLMCFSTVFFGRYYGVLQMMIGNLAINTLIGAGYGTSIFLKKRKIWHQ
jgi:hypothetical protein